LELRQGITFHDGTPFDADAVKANLEYAKSTKSSTKVQDSLAAVDSVEVVDADTVRLNLNRPSVGITAALSSGAGAMVSPQALATGVDLSGTTPDAGTGPYNVLEFTPDVGVTYERIDDNYWDPNQANIKKIVLTFAGEGQTRAAALQAGQADLIQIVTADLETLESGLVDAGFVSHGIDTALGQAMWLRADGPFADKRVRQAIAYALDRESLVDGLFAGNCKAKGAIYQPGSDVYDEANADLYTYDPDKAQALLEEAGVDGSLEFSVAAGSGATYERIATVQQQSLKDMGVTSSIELVPTSQSQVVFRDGTVNAMWTGVTQSLSPVSTMSGIAANTIGDATIEGKLNDLIARADAELDDDARWELLREAEHLVLDEVWVIPLCESRQAWFSTPNIVNVDNMPLVKTGIPDLMGLGVVAD
ncbi:MAG: ABC transporter substrate-binding protein, partial [Acidimicrobiia bacterium]